MFSEVMRYILDLGPTVMLPIVIIIFSKILGMKAGDCFKAGLHIGIGFVGIGLVIGLMLDSIGPAAKAMAENFDLNLHVVDVGWPGSSPMTWASQIALVAIPIAILVNVAMLLTRMTRVVNVDIWNIWHMTFTGALLHLATGSWMIGMAGVVIHAAFVYKLGDWFARDTRNFFELEGIAIPHGTSAYMGPIAVLVDAIIEKIPGVNRIKFSADDIQRNTLPTVRLFGRLVLRVDTTHAHRFIDARQPQRVSHFYIAGKRSTGDHQPGAFHGKCAVDRQTKTLILRIHTLRKLQQMRA